MALSFQELAARVARQYGRPHYDVGRLTQVWSEDFPLEVPEMRFQEAMAKFARSLGGTYRDGRIRLRVAPNELTVLYQKWYDQGGPRVAFMVFPTKEGNRSKMYRVFESPVKGSKRVFNQFIAWLGTIGSAIQQNAYGASDLARRMKNGPLVSRVAARYQRGLVA